MQITNFLTDLRYNLAVFKYKYLKVSGPRTFSSTLRAQKHVTLRAPLKVLPLSIRSLCGIKIKEALHLLWEKPTLNAQVKHVNLKLSV